MLTFYTEIMLAYMPGDRKSPSRRRSFLACSPANASDQIFGWPLRSSRRTTVAYPSTPTGRAEIFQISHRFQACISFLGRIQDCQRNEIRTDGCKRHGWSPHGLPITHYALKRLILILQRLTRLTKFKKLYIN